MSFHPRFRRILLVNPPNVEQGGYTPSPLGLLYLAAYLRLNKKIKIRVVDGAIEGERAIINAIKSFKPDLVGISSMTPGRHEAVSVANLIKHFRPQTSVVLGGIHPTIMWKQMMENYPSVDFIVRGEGENTLNELVLGKQITRIDGLVWRNKHSLVINNSDRELISDLNRLPFPAWDLIKPQKYPPWGKGLGNGINLEKETRYPILFSRGCMGCCTFCSSWKVWKGYRNRSGDNVVDEMELLIRQYHAKHFVFYDDTLTGNRKEIIKFCRMVVKKKFHIAIHGTTRVDKVDSQLLRWMRKAGFYEVSYGIESCSPEMLTSINKKTNLNLIVRAAKLTKLAGIRVCALIMYGLPRETVHDRLLTEKLLLKIKPDSIGSVGAVWVFPGTALYEQAKNARLIDDSYWLGTKPYYIYRGGIGNDKLNWLLHLKDELMFTLRDTGFEEPVELIFIKARHLRQKLISIAVHLRGVYRD